MTTNKILEAIGMINDEAIRDAKAYKKPDIKVVSRKWFKLGAIAACLCIVLLMNMFVNHLTSGIVKGPGLLTITAYALSPSDEADFFEERQMQEGIELPGEYGWSLAINSRPGLPLTLSMPEYPNITFDISISNGQFILWEPGDGVTAPVTKNITYLGSSFSVGNDTTLYWNNMFVTRNTQTGERVVERYMGSEAYADIVMRDGKNIVGYAVIKIYTVDLDNAPAQNYQAILLKSVSFPKANGHYQNVTDKYVASEIESVKVE